MKIAIVHDYIKEYGGAERVLEALTETFPDAPIYTAFCDKTSNAYQHFKNNKIISSWFDHLPFAAKLSSPLRFLTPFIWGSFSFKEYDIVLSSASWFITKGFGSNLSQDKANKPVEICYCHTPPRWLYGYQTSVNFKKHLLVRIYALIIGHFLRLYDFKQAQKVNYFVANSKEVASRIQKFYRRDAVVIYPPVSLPNQSLASDLKPLTKNYYLIVSRIVGAKGLELAVDAAVKMGFKLKIVGSPSGYFNLEELMNKAKSKSLSADKQIEFLGQVDDLELAKLYSQAKAFLALSKDEDFGITPVEAQLFGTAVIAFNNGGYKETVIDKKTGILFDDYSLDGLITAIKKFESIKINPESCIVQAKKFSKERFIKEIKEFVVSASKS
jgi:glycosyltransferase involved in cell wall biosynthesis